jgi:hypothetical protein
MAFFVQESKSNYVIVYLVAFAFLSFLFFPDSRLDTVAQRALVDSFHPLTTAQVLRLF